LEIGLELLLADIAQVRPQSSPWCGCPARHRRAMRSRSVSGHVAALIGAREGAAVIPLRGW